MDKKQWIYLLVVFVVGVIAGIIINNSGGNAYVKNIMRETDREEINTSTEQEVKPGEQKDKPIIKDVTPTMTYDEASKEFAGKRIQFDNCKAQPSSMTFTSDTKIMFDNRDNITIEVTIDGVVKSISAYQFKIIAISNSNLPHTVKIDCKNSLTEQFNVAQLLIQ